jgi:hypothetical protein
LLSRVFIRDNIAISPDGRIIPNQVTQETFLSSRV